MSHWASKRKLAYIGAFFVLVFAGLAVPTFLAVYEAPTCSDGKQNQKELGVDCGGPCSILCEAQAFNPIVLWQRSFKGNLDMYNAVAYIENPNLDSSARNLPYIFKFYDERGVLIFEREGKTDVLANRIFPIFEDRIETKGRVPAKVTFEFTREPIWEVDESQPLDIRVSSQSLLSDRAFPRVVGTVENKSSTPLFNVEVVAIVYDSNDNAVTASRTFIEKLDKNSSADVVFTWPGALDFGENICEKPADVMLVIDRSGSMDDDSISPPEPLTAVKSSAMSFVDNLKENDRVGIVSFASSVKDPIDEVLSPDFISVKKIISDIAIDTDGLQNTNIGEGILKALQELQSVRHRLEAKPVIVLLTDGIPSEPLIADDPEYPKKYVLSAGEEVKNKKAELYVIGLGENVDSPFLKSLATRPELYFETLASGGLTKIYQAIATEICQKGPTKIQIVPLVP